MKGLKITVLAKDIWSTSYTNSQDCAMTRAFRRAGLEAHEGGGFIYLDNETDKMDTPRDLDVMVQGMYATRYPDSKWTIAGVDIPLRDVEDLEYMLLIPDHWLINPTT